MMIRVIKNFLPYILTSLVVIGIWWMLTSPENYAWYPIGKGMLMLELALLSIFYYKTTFWLVVANLMVFSLTQLIKHNYRPSGIALSITIAVYIFAGRAVDRMCAYSYYVVFVNQSVTEEYIDSPILEAGYQIGPIITENIERKHTRYRRYAINGLKKLHYEPATPALKKILFDTTEIDVFRADALEALGDFDTDEAREAVSSFKREAKDPVDLKVVEMVEYWARVEKEN